jgi:hypothetical protein
MGTTRSGCGERGEQASERSEYYGGRGGAASIRNPQSEIRNCYGSAYAEAFAFVLLVRDLGGPLAMRQIPVDGSLDAGRE